MQGDLSEIDIRSILQLLELGQRTGELYIESAPGGQGDGRRERGTPRESWIVFVANGHIIYAGTTDGQLHRLQDHLCRFGIEPHRVADADTSAIAPFNTPEYGCLWALLENHVLTPSQGRTILSHMIYETLFDLLSLRQGSFAFKLGTGLSPQLTTLDISALVAGITTQIQEWNQLHPQVQSPQQCPLILDQDAFRQGVSAGSFARLVTWMDGKTSMRQLARYLGRDLVSVAKSLHGPTQQGIVQLISRDRNAPPVPSGEMAWPSDRLPRIVCVDDGLTVRQTVEHILDGHGYEATSIGNPLKALSLLFQLQPDLILCDIAMPQLEGYELCAMLRSSTTFRETPIIMLTGKDGFLDRIKARMSGATDYLTKPFGAGELLALVERYIGPGDPLRPRPDTVLAEVLEDDLSLDLESPAPKSLSADSPG